LRVFDDFGVFKYSVFKYSLDRKPNVERQRVYRYSRVFSYIRENQTAPKSKGIPCSCKLHELRVSGHALQVTNIDQHWYLTKPTGVINNTRAPVLDPLPTKVGGRKRIAKAKGKGHRVISITRDLSITLATDMFNLTP
jgi:hypothetical protein